MIIVGELKQYIEHLIADRHSIVMEMEQHARETNVPIMELIGIEVLLQLLKFVKPSRVLEIGTAIGYSAIRMAESLPDATIITIERDQDRYDQAITYIQRAGLTGQIDVKFGDALELESEIAQAAPFDCLFIDAAKGQYERFFTIYSKYVTQNGIIISDNILFRGLVANREIENKRLKRIVSKIKDYNEWLMNHDDYETTIYPVGDGIAVSRKR